MYYLVNSDNFGGDYSDESFLGAVSEPPMSLMDLTHTKEEAQAQPYADKDAADTVAASLNLALGEGSHRYYKVVSSGYKLQPGFEP
jgi:hypothetical protein